MTYAESIERYWPGVRQAQLARNNPSRGWLPKPPSQATIEARQREARYLRVGNMCPVHCMPRPCDCDDLRAELEGKVAHVAVTR